jgi:hypothetical protein
LFGGQPQLYGYLLQAIDRGPVNAGLAGFAQAAVTGVDAVPFEQTVEGGRATVHSRRLDDLGRQEATSFFIEAGGHALACRASSAEKQLHRAESRYDNFFGFCIAEQGYGVRGFVNGNVGPEKPGQPAAQEPHACQRQPMAGAAGSFLSIHAVSDKIDG